MRSYRQKCGLAKALDVIGDRWTLLLIREILIRGACRYTDLQKGLPGIATNLLASRLQGLERAGVIRTEMMPPPVATTLYFLTARGQELEAAILQLGLWGAPLLAGAARRERLQSHWIVLPLRLYARDNNPDAPLETVELRVGGEFITVTAQNGTADVRMGRVSAPTGVLTGTAECILDFFAGRTNLARALASGMTCGADLGAILRVIPRTNSVKTSGTSEKKKRVTLRDASFSLR